MHTRTAAADHLTDARRARTHGLHAAAVTSYLAALQAALAAPGTAEPVEATVVHGLLRDERDRVLRHGRDGVLTASELDHADTVITALLTSAPPSGPSSAGTGGAAPQIVIQQPRRRLGRFLALTGAVTAGTAIAAVILALLAFHAAKDTVSTTVDKVVAFINPPDITGPGTLEITGTGRWTITAAAPAPAPVVDVHVADLELAGDHVRVLRTAAGWTVRVRSTPTLKVRRDRSVFARRARAGDHLQITVRQHGKTIATTTVTLTS